MNYYFASIDESSFVNAVHIISDEFCTNADGDFDENIAIEYLNNFHGQSKWVRTCRDSTIRYNYAGIGYYYYEEYDAFVPPKPASGDFILTESFRWVSVDVSSFLDAIEVD